MRVGLVGLWWIKSTRLTLVAHNTHRPTRELLHCKSLDTQVQFHKSRGNFTIILPQMGSFRVGPPTPPI